MTTPNLLFILADDLGWRDLSCYGSTFYETPNLDRLARLGVRFTDGYASCPVCSPTRASLLTGKTPATLGMTDWVDWSGQWHPLSGRVTDAPYEKGLPAGETTLARALRDGGYRAWHIGKWHVGGEGQLPQDVGFEENVGGCAWGMPQNGYFSPWGIPGLEDGPEGAYLTDRLTDEAIERVRRRDDRPFFLNLCYYSVHTPIEAPSALIEKYRRKAAIQGLDRIDPLRDGDPFPADQMDGAVARHRMVQSDPAYAAMVEALDTNIGRLLDALEETGKAENTLVVFTSDNGGLSTGGFYEHENAPTCNLPLRTGKGWMYDGGIRTPWIVRWPGRVRPETVHRGPVASPDLYPAFLEAAGLPPRPEQHCDGVSFLPALGETPDSDRGPVYWHYPHYGNQGGSPASAARNGDWKLIEFLEDGTCELYNLANDPGETRDLAAAEPDRTAAMRTDLARWRESVGARMPRAYPEKRKQT